MFSIALAPNLQEATAIWAGMMSGFLYETSVGNEYSGTKGLFFHVTVHNKSSNAGYRVQNRLALISSSFHHVSKY